METIKPYCESKGRAGSAERTPSTRTVAAIRIIRTLDYGQDDEFAVGLGPMECPECTQLMAERERRKVAYTMAVSHKVDAKNAGDLGKYADLSEGVQVAQIDLNLIEAAIDRHQETHAPMTTESWRYNGMKSQSAGH